MTPTNTTAKNADAAQGGSPLTSLTDAVANFEAAQSAALAALTRHAQTAGEEVARLAERPTREELAEVQSELEKSRSSHSREVEELKSTIAARDAQLAELQAARATDAATIASLQERFRSFEVAAQSIMAGLAGDFSAPAAVAVSGQEPAGAPAVQEPAAAAPPTDEKAAPRVASDPFGLDAPAAEPALKTAPAGLIIPDLDEGDPFGDDPGRAALLAQAVGTDDPFGLPEVADQDVATAAAEAPAGQQAGAIVDDPFAFMDLDTPAAPTVQEAPKVVPVYI